MKHGEKFSAALFSLFRIFILVQHPDLVVKASGLHRLHVQFQPASDALAEIGGVHALVVIFPGLFLQPGEKFAFRRSQFHVGHPVTVGHGLREQFQNSQQEHGADNHIGRRYHEQFHVQPLVGKQYHIGDPADQQNHQGNGKGHTHSEFRVQTPEQADPDESADQIHDEHLALRAAAQYRDHQQHRTCCRPQESAAVQCQCDIDHQKRPRPHRQKHAGQGHPQTDQQAQIKAHQMLLVVILHQMLRGLLADQQAQHRHTHGRHHHVSQLDILPCLLQPSQQPHTRHRRGQQPEPRQQMIPSVILFLFTHIYLRPYFFSPAPALPLRFSLYFSFASKSS